MLELAPNDAIIKTYLQDIQRIKHDQQIAHEKGLRGPFQYLLDKAAKKRGWTLVPELSTYSGGTLGRIKDDPRHSRGEIRRVLLGSSERHRLLAVMFTERDEVIRVISARRATRRERKSYEQQSPGAEQNR